MGMIVEDLLTKPVDPCGKTTLDMCNPSQAPFLVSYNSHAYHEPIRD